MIYRITPVPKPRMTQRDRWAERPAVLRFRAFKDEARLRGMRVDPGRSDVTFHIPMPKSWSKRKRTEMIGQPHQSRPDLDNYLKALFDACHEEDSGIWQISARKVWGVTGLIEIIDREREG